MDTYTIAIAVGVTILVVAIIYYSLTSKAVASTTYPITTVISDGRTPFSSKLYLPPSDDQDPGMSFSYACWVKIDDFSYKYGEPKVIFSKGPTDLSSMCPALFLDSNSNSLIVKLDTFGGTEVIPIGNIPAKKWIHVAIAVSQSAVDIYVNGTLYMHHTLVNVPRQNDDVAHVGLNGGFNGQIASLQHFRYLLNASSINELMQSTPQADTSVSGSLPPYSGISFWTSH